MRAARFILGVLGLAAMGYALLGAAGDPDINPSRHAGFLVTVLVLNDGAVLPTVLLAGVLVHRFVPPPHRAILQAALVATGSVTVIAVPLVLGYGRIADNPSALPRDYGHGLATVLAMIWLAAAIVILVRARRSARACLDVLGRAEARSRRRAGKAAFRPDTGVVSGRKANAAGRCLDPPQAGQAGRDRT